MASILSNIRVSPTLKVYDSDSNNQVMKGLKVESVNISIPTKTADNPLSGTPRSSMEVIRGVIDSDLSITKVFMPTRVEVNAFTDDRATEENIINQFNNQSRLFNITSRSVTSDNMVIESVEFIHDEDLLNATQTNIVFEQAFTDSFNSFMPVRTADASTDGTVMKQISNISAEVNNLYNKVLSTIGI